MTALLIIGAGGNGRVVADVASSTGCWDQIAFLDDSPPGDWSHPEFPIIGRCADLGGFTDDFPDITIGFGDNALRSHWSDRAVDSGFNLAIVVSPSACVSTRAELGPGSVVMPHAVVNIGVVTGLSVLINTAATVDHDCILGDCVHVSPGANLGGEVRVGARSWLGIGCSVRNMIQIGSDAVVGAGAVVVSDVGNDVTVMGVPARVASRP